MRSSLSYWHLIGFYMIGPDRSASSKFDFGHAQNVRTQVVFDIKHTGNVYTVWREQEGRTESKLDSWPMCESYVELEGSSNFPTIIFHHFFNMIPILLHDRTRYTSISSICNTCLKSSAIVLRACWMRGQAYLDRTRSV